MNNNKINKLIHITKSKIIKINLLIHNLINIKRAEYKIKEKWNLIKNESVLTKFINK